MKTRKLIYPLTPQKMEESYRTDENECKDCNAPQYLKTDYCTLGICAKDIDENKGGRLKCLK